MLVTCIIFTALFAEVVKTQSSSLAIGVIVMVSLYFFHYDIAVTPLAFGKSGITTGTAFERLLARFTAYPTEVCPSMRAKKAWESSCSSMASLG